MNFYELHTGRIAIIGPGRLGTAFAYKFGRDNRRVTIYYPDADVCKTINSERRNPLHLTNDLAKKLGGIDKVPPLPDRVGATNDLEYVVTNNDFIILALTVERLPGFLSSIRDLLHKKEGGTCFISPLKGMLATDNGKTLLTPSMIAKKELKSSRGKYQLLAIGGPFFDTDIALGNPVCVNVAGNRRLALFVRENLIKFNRREFTSYYNHDVIGVEVCGALKNIIANIKGVSDSLALGSSIPGTLFSRAGVEMRTLCKLLGGNTQAFLSLAGIGDMYVTVSSEASKNYRYGRHFLEMFEGNHQDTHQRVLRKIDGTPEGPNTIKNVHTFLKEYNIYSPLFKCAYDIFNHSTSKAETRESIIQACQMDRRSLEYVKFLSRLLRALAPRRWYRRERGFFSRWDVS